MKLRVSAAVFVVLGTVICLSNRSPHGTIQDGFATCAGAQQPDDTQSGGLPPLTIDRSKPLLLLDEPEKAKPENKASLRLNHACFVCHTNYKEEGLVNQHANEKIGCMDCHGESFDHRNDEDNITPPDVMYPLDEINDACKDCHDEHNVWPGKVVERWLQRCPDKKDMKALVCTDCHGHHRLERRVVRWNKRTGELLANKKEPEVKGDQ